MDSARRRAEAIVARHISDYEAAAQIVTEIDKRIYEKSQKLLEDYRKRYAWEGGWEKYHQTEYFWLAPVEWRSPGKRADESYDLYCELEIDKPQHVSKLAALSGVSQSGSINLCLYSDSAGQKNISLGELWGRQKILEQEILAEGYRLDKECPMVLFRSLSFSSESVVKSLEDGDLADALTPIGEALQKIYDDRALLDKLVKAIREFPA